MIPNNTKHCHVFDNTKENYSLLKKHNWYENYNGHLYATIKNKTYFSYWFILGEPEKNKVVDHIDRNPRNNQKSNLRFSTLNQNRINAKINTNNKTGYKGVCYRKETGKYRAYIHKNKKFIELGLFDTPEKAYEARAKAEIEFYGEYANIMDEFKHLMKDGDINEI